MQLQRIFIVWGH